MTEPSSLKHRLLIYVEYLVSLAAFALLVVTIGHIVRMEHLESTRLREGWPGEHALLVTNIRDGGRAGHFLNVETVYGHDFEISEYDLGNEKPVVGVGDFLIKLSKPTEHYAHYRIVHRCQN